MSRIVVIGNGVDALVAAHLLAQARHEVTVAAERPALPDAPEPGWVPPSIVRALDLGQHGLDIHAPDLWAVAVLPDGEWLELTRDVAATAEAIGNKLGQRDGARWPAFCTRMHALAGLLEHLYLAPPPDPLATSPGGLIDLARAALRVRGLGRKGMEDLFRLLPMPAADWLDEWFESDVLKGVLGGAAVMHLAQGPRSGGTSFNLLHHCVGSPAGVFRPPLSNLRGALARRGGLSARGGVARIDVREGRVFGVTLTDGETLACDAVVSGLAPSRTLLELIDPGLIDPQLVRAIRAIRSRGAVAQIALTLDRAPRFTTLVLAPSLTYLERAYDAFKYREISPAPYIEARYTGAEAQDRHRVDLHVQYVPHALKEGPWDTARAEAFGRTIVAKLTEHVPGFADRVIGSRVMTPDDLEYIHGFPQGQAYHAELALDQILWMRPLPQLAQYRTPIRGLYLCGPAMHPGGGVAGAAGANAASAVLRDLRRAA